MQNFSSSTQTDHKLWLKCIRRVALNFYANEEYKWTRPPNELGTEENSAPVEAGPEEIPAPGEVGPYFKSTYVTECNC